MTPAAPARRIAVIGVGNPYRRDDGVGPAIIAELTGRCPSGVTLTVADGEPSQLLDAWAGMDLAVVVDAVQCEPSTPGRIHRTSIGAWLPAASAGSTHGLGIPDAVRLAEVLELAPRELVVFAVEADDLGFGLGLSAAVADALPALVQAVVAEIGAGPGTPDGERVTSVVLGDDGQREAGMDQHPVPHSG